MPAIKTLGFTLTLAAALTAAPAPADQPAGSPAPSLEAIQKDVKELKEATLKGLKEQLDRIEKSLGAVEGLKRDIDNLSRIQDLTNQITKRTQADLAKLEEQLRAQEAGFIAKLGKLEEELKAQTQRNEELKTELVNLRKKMTETTQRVAAAPVTPETGFGSIRMFNTSDREVSIVINNGASYRLAPGESWTVASHPVGPFTYEVLGLGYPERRSGVVVAGMPKDIEVYDLARGPQRTPRRPQ
jgi:hypothetical protein